MVSQAAQAAQTDPRIVNHAASYWKHGDEWALGNRNGQQAKTEEGLEALLADFEEGYLAPMVVILVSQGGQAYGALTSL